MRVYIINANWGHGGPGGIAADLYYALEKAGHTCRFAYARDTVPEGVNSYRIGTKADVYLHALSARIFDNAGFMSERATKGLIEDIKSFKPDVINLHNPLGYSVHVEKLFTYFRSCEAKVVWTLHDCWSITGHCITGICANLKNGCGNCPQKRAYPKSCIFDRSAQNLIRKQKCFSDIPGMRLVTPSYWLGNLIKTTYLRDYSLNVIPNGIDLEVFKPQESDLAERYHISGKTVILAVAGIWEKTKGAAYFYELSEIMGEQYAFVLIGQNNDRYLKKSDRVIHIPRTEDRQQLAQWYTLADVFVNPTVGDNFPTVNLEALACGTPVVTFDTGGSGEAVGQCGAVVPQGDVAALKKGIEGSLSIPREACLARAGLYDKGKRYQEYIDLFRELTT